MRVLLVSKPVAPPWNDSSKNLVRDLARGMQTHTPVVLSRPGVSLDLPRARVEPLYPKEGRFAPSMADNLRVLRRLVFRRLLPWRREHLWHFFFAPNPRSSTAARWAVRARRVPSVQTLCSPPRAELDVRSLLFADRSVVLSEHTERRLLEAGVPAHAVRRIPPGIEPLPVPSMPVRLGTRAGFDLPQGAPLLVYPGDLEFGGGAEVAVDALASLPKDVWLVLACRAKTERAAEAEKALRERVARRGLTERVRWVGETPRIHALLGAADAVLLPSADLYAKMDYPLVLLEAMSMSRPVFVARGTPAEELSRGGAAVAVEPSGDALAAALAPLLDDADARAAVGERARQRILASHDVGTMARAYETLYEELLGD